MAIDNLLMKIYSFQLLTTNYLETSENSFLSSPNAFVGDPVIKILKNIKVLMIGWPGVYPPLGARESDKECMFFRSLQLLTEVTHFCHSEQAKRSEVKNPEASYNWSIWIHRFAQNYKKCVLVTSDTNYFSDINYGF